jgi:hypothetical protein
MAGNIIEQTGRRGGGMTLHDNQLTPYEWWACSEPERVADMETIYDERCPACVLKAQVELRLNGDGQLEDLEGIDNTWRLSDVAGGRGLTVAA